MVIDSLRNAPRRKFHLALTCFTGQLSGLKFGDTLDPTDKTLKENKSRRSLYSAEKMRDDISKSLNQNTPFLVATDRLTMFLSVCKAQQGRYCTALI